MTARRRMLRFMKLISCDLLPVAARHETGDGDRSIVIVGDPAGVGWGGRFSPRLTRLRKRRMGPLAGPAPQERRPICGGPASARRFRYLALCSAFHRASAERD